MKNPRRIKGMVGNGASCFRFFHPLGQGSNPFSRSRMKSDDRNPPKGSGRWHFRTQDMLLPGAVVPPEDVRTGQSGNALI
jgi:hypothetical protein